MEPKEIPSGLIPHPLVEITQQLVFLVTALRRCDFFSLIKSYSGLILNSLSSLKPGLALHS